MRSLTLVSFFLSLSVFAQIEVDTTINRNQIAEMFLGDGVSIFNVRTKGNSSSIGSFTALNSNFPMEKGIVLSTGRVSAIAGQNLSNKTSTSMSAGMETDYDLSRMVTKKLTNATVLEFDFIPMFDSLYFDYVFGSEEYPEYVGSVFNDVFCLLITGPNFQVPVNLARVGNPPKVVMVNSVNQNRNSDFFVPNHQFTPTDSIPFTIEYDGFTTLLTASCRVTRGKKHHIKIAIGNVQDYAYDSGVFLRAGSFGSRGGIRPMSVPFDFDARNPNPIYENLLDSVAKLLLDNPGWKVAVLGHTDSLGTTDYNLALSEDRANAVAKALIGRGVRSEQLFVKGYGANKPLRSNRDEEGRQKNRRVEIIIRNE